MIESASRDREVMLERSNDMTRDRFEIHLVTLQIESGTCAVQCCGGDDTAKVF